MEFRKVQALRGPNIWANFPVLEAWVDLGALKDTSSEMMPGFNERLMAWLPSLVEHRCSVGERGGFFERLRRGTYLAHILEHVTLELQSLAGTEVSFGRARETSEDGVYKVAIQYHEEDLGREALQVARNLCLAAVEDRPFDVAAEVERLQELARDICLGPSTAAIVRAARNRGIPVKRLNKHSLVQFGYGNKQHRIQAAETDRTSAIAEAIAQDKQLTRTLLRQIGVPAPEGRPVTSPEDAWEAAEEIGLPVVVKPQYGNQGRGVATNLKTREQVLAAYAAARVEEETVMVESFAPGDDYRLLVIGDKVVAAARRESAHVIGDGLRSITDLIDEVNLDPRRSDGHATSLSRIRIDAVGLEVLKDQGYTPDSIPAAGVRVLIRRNGNLSTGGTATDVTDQVHPDVAAQAVDAARMIGLDIAGIDIVCCDISKPLVEQKGVIVEVNAAPGLRMHLEPSEGTPRAVGEMIVESMYPAGANGRIPVVAITGVNGKTTTTRLIAHILSITGKKVGMTCTDGIYVAGRRIEVGDCSGPLSAQTILMNPSVEAAVLETARGGILRAGLGFDRCDVAVVTNIGEGDHLGLSDIDTVEKLARVKRTIVDVVAKEGAAVLKADDPLVAEMAAHCPGSVVFFALDPDHPLLVRRRSEGGRVVFVRDGSIVLAEGPLEIPLLSLERIPLTHNGKVGFQVENTLAATAAAWHLGIPAEAIRAGLETFASSMGKSPGRFNLFDINGATVIVDYGHNTSSLQAILEVVDQFPHERRTAVYSAAGDRRNEDMIRQGELLGGAFDRVIIYEDHYLRGRALGEITQYFRQGLTTGKRVKHVAETHGWIKAIEETMKHLQPGDLVLMQADTIDESVEYIRKTVSATVPVREIDLKEAMKIGDGVKVQIRR